MQPAVSKVRVIFPRSYFEPVQQSGWVVNPSGVTMGDIRSADWVDETVAARCVGGNSIEVRLYVNNQWKNGTLMHFSCATSMRFI